MQRAVLRLLRAPSCGHPVRLSVLRCLDTQPDDVADGILMCESCRTAYPIIDGVPVMLDATFPSEWLNRYREQIASDGTLAAVELRSSPESRAWSFSAQWDLHFSHDLSRTWGWTTQSRIEQLLEETGTSAEWWKSKVVLDLGCGNGQLTDGLAQYGATIVGFDYSTSVFQAEARRRSKNVHFVRGDLHMPPFAAETFDLVFSNGVLHHTRDTYESFVRAAQLVKSGGRLYMWLYRRPEGFFKRYGVYPALDAIRTMTARSPRVIQKLVVFSYATTSLLWHRVRGEFRDLSWSERLVGSYDTLTPLWRHYHSPIEVSRWFFSNGYSAATLTHWDNPYGFGVVASKMPQVDTPGVNFGKART